MTKAKYMALADLQSVWSDFIKPWINQNKADKADVTAFASTAESEAAANELT